MIHDPESSAGLAVVVLISGRGSNLQALIEARARGRLAIDICGVISNVPGAQGLARASAAGIPNWVVDNRAYPQREVFDEALAECIDRLAPQLVVLAGFMRILGRNFVARYAGRIINIHPSLLPAFPGLDTHKRALAAGVPEHGTSVHYVSADLDGGPLIAQARVPVYPGDTETELADRVLEQEHRLLPEVINSIAQGRIRYHQGQVLIDDKPVVPRAASAIGDPP